MDGGGEGGKGYLVVGRREGQSVVLTLPGVGEVTVSLLEVARGRARLGVEAPAAVRVSKAPPAG